MHSYLKRFTSLFSLTIKRNGGVITMGVIKSLFEIFIQTIPYLAVFLFGLAAVASAIQQDDLFPPLTFSIFFTISFIFSSCSGVDGA